MKHVMRIEPDDIFCSMDEMVPQFDQLLYANIN